MSLIKRLRFISNLQIKSYHSGWRVKNRLGTDFDKKYEGFVARITGKLSRTHTIFFLNKLLSFVVSQTLIIKIIFKNYNLIGNF